MYWVASQHLQQQQYTIRFDAYCRMRLRQCGTACIARANFAASGRISTIKEKNGCRPGRSTARRARDHLGVSFQSHPGEYHVASTGRRCLLCELACGRRLTPSIAAGQRDNLSTIAVTGRQYADTYVVDCWLTSHSPWLDAYRYWTKLSEICQFSSLTHTRTAAQISDVAGDWKATSMLWTDHSILPLVLNLNLKVSGKEAVALDPPLCTVSIQMSCQSPATLFHYSETKLQAMCCSKTTWIRSRLLS